MDSEGAFGGRSSAASLSRPAETPLDSCDRLNGQARRVTTASAEPHGVLFARGYSQFEVERI